MKDQPSPERRLFNMFAPGIAYVAVNYMENGSTAEAIGTCFHIGDDVFITARHVVDGRKICRIATVHSTTDIMFGNYLPTEARDIKGPFFHPNPDYDIAALKLPGLRAPQIPFLPMQEELSDQDLLLRSVVVMGFPPIPGSKSPVLVCARAEVNASFVSYFDDQRILIVSSMARGGFSGGPALTPPHHCLGVVTRAMVKATQPEELGFMAVIGPWPILELLDHNRIMPGHLRTGMWPLKGQRHSIRRF